MSIKVHSNLDDLSAFDFPVELKDIYDGFGDKIKGYKRVVRQDTATPSSDGSTLAIHSDSYHLTPHVDVFKSTVDVIKEAFGDNYILNDDIQRRIELERYKIKDFIINEGRQVCREIIVLTEQIDGPDGHPIQFRLRQINSYDGSSRYYMLAGTYRQWCSNGAASLLGTISSTSQKHTSKINVSAEVGKLRKAIEVFRCEPELYKAWMKTAVTTEHVAALFQRTLTFEKKTHDKTAFGNEYIKYNKKQFEVLMSAWERNSLQLGRNKWAIYQAATWWASHGEGRSRSAEEISLEREPKVLAMVQSDEWDDL
jgi:hypothetical protein